MTAPPIPVIADLDGDGLIEIASCGSISPSIVADLFHVIESPANDTWVVTFTDSSGISQGGHLVGGRDTDGNGRPEVFISGNYYDDSTKAYRKTVVFESTGNDQFTRVASWCVMDGSSGVISNALGNMDGTGPVYMMEGLDRIHVYRAVAPGQWPEIGGILDPTTWYQLNAPQLYDIDGNGRDEIFWPTGAQFESTLVLEHPGVPPTDAAGLPGPGFGNLVLSPNPCRRQVTLSLRVGTEGPMVLSVFDAAGRLVERRLPVVGPRGRPVWSAENQAAGVYYLRLENHAGAPLGSGRLVVLGGRGTR